MANSYFYITHWILLTFVYTKFIQFQSKYKLDNNSPITGAFSHVDVLYIDIYSAFNCLTKMKLFSNCDKQSSDFCATMMDGPKILAKYRL